MDDFISRCLCFRKRDRVSNARVACLFFATYVTGVLLEFIKEKRIDSKFWFDGTRDDRRHNKSLCFQRVPVNVGHNSRSRTERSIRKSLLTASNKGSKSFYRYRAESRSRSRKRLRIDGDFKKHRYGKRTRRTTTPRAVRDPRKKIDFFSAKPFDRFFLGREEL